MKNLITLTLCVSFASLTFATIHNISVAPNSMHVFEPTSLTITIGDTVKFVWASGNHTTTSDATTGADSWDAPINTTDTCYIVVLTTVGTHPYYCIPHGNPGGVGMSGTIVVQDVGTGIKQTPTSSTFDVRFNNASGSLTLPSNLPAHFEIRIYDVLGVEVLTERANNLSEGEILLPNNKTNMFLLLIADGNTIIQTEKLMLLR